ncbi:hypothetical protein LJR290_007456 [Variovorax sp. LjRoot290]|uniref:hypothetical protein n=1 Tax=Variovorax sp. LjRoot290 TaxID=3342316 RepID=UPI003ECCD7A2
MDETLMRRGSKPSLPSAPLLADRATGARVVLAPFATFDLPFARGEVGAGRSAYDDLVGPNIGAVMARVGWRFDGSMMRVDALLPVAGSAGSDSLIVASGWGGPIRARDGTRGINVSYGVGAAHRGAELGRMLAYCAVAECLAHQALAGEPIPTFVNIQARATNGASLAVAQSLGVPPCESAAFAVPASGKKLAYVGFREPVQEFLARGLAHAKSRLPDYDPGSLAAARMGLISELGADLDLLGWLEDSTVDAEMVSDHESERFHSGG